MWTDTTRALHARDGLVLPSDLTNAEWAILEPLLPSVSYGLCRKNRWAADLGFELDAERL